MVTVSAEVSIKNHRSGYHTYEVRGDTFLSRGGTVYNRLVRFRCDETIGRWVSTE